MVAPEVVVIVVVAVIKYMYRTFRAGWGLFYSYKIRAYTMGSRTEFTGPCLSDYADTYAHDVCVSLAPSYEFYVSNLTKVKYSSLIISLHISSPLPVRNS